MLSENELFRHEKAIEAIIIDGRSWEDFRRARMSKYLEVAFLG